MDRLISLAGHPVIYVRQRRELAELFGFETRNKYSIETEQGQVVGFAAEQSTGLLGAVFRLVFGHWRKFEIHVFDADRKPILKLAHPFRFLFQRLEITTSDGEKLGAIQQRFSFFTKSFDLENASGEVFSVVRSGFLSFWTFIFRTTDAQGGEEIARVEKKWSGGLKEIFTDADNFKVSLREGLSSDVSMCVLAAALFIDLQYFERKSGS